LWHVFGSGLGIFLLVLQLYQPLAGHAANGIDWIGIRGEFGAIEIKVETDGTDTPDCPDCPACAMCALTFMVTPESVIRSASSDASLSPRAPSKADLAVQNPGQFWPDNRGPPQRKITTSRQPGRVLSISFLLKGEAS